MASEVFFHWFTFVLLSSNLLTLSKICLLILLTSDFDQLMSLNDRRIKLLIDAIKNLTDAINFAKSSINITEQDLSIIM